MKRIRCTALLLALLLAASALLSACAAPAPPAQSSTAAAAPAPPATPPSPAARFDTPEGNAAYLKEYFSVELPQTVTAGAFVQALLSAGGNPAAAEAVPNTDEALTVSAAVKSAVIAANLQELALVYTEEQLSAYAAFGDAAAYAACAAGNALLPAELAADPAQTVDKAAADGMVMAVADTLGTARMYLGYTTDADIAQKLTNAWETFEILEDEVLLAIGRHSVENKVTTGYNLRSADYDARFLPELTLRYGHSSIEHARQLVGLLAAQGVTARVQLEPKTSIYEYLLEWGEPGEPTDTYKVEKVNDNLYLAHATEYDLVLEFANQEDRAAFDGVILQYAKKNEGEEGKALLTDSWWQPLYVSHVEMGEGYQPIFDNVLTHGKYSLHPFSLEEDKDYVAEQLNAVNPEVQVEAVPIWCNEAFFRYLNGDDSQ